MKSCQGYSYSTSTDQGDAVFWRRRHDSYGPCKREELWGTGFIFMETPYVSSDEIFLAGNNPTDNNGNSRPQQTAAS